MTKQRAWQLRQIEAGRCRICGGRRQHHADRCDGCRVFATGYERRRYQRIKARRRAAQEK